jgi:hypothetical protein
LSDKTGRVEEAFDLFITDCLSIPKQHWFNEEIDEQVATKSTKSTKRTLVGLIVC